jgi:hypothetical protein
MHSTSRGFREIRSRSRKAAPTTTGNSGQVATCEMTAAQSAAITAARTLPMHTQALPSPHHQRLLGAALLWLLSGGALLLTTLVPLHTELLGWTPTFWLLGAPLVVLLVLEPALPRLLLARCRPRRRAAHGLIWH